MGPIVKHVFGVLEWFYMLTKKYTSPKRHYGFFHYPRWPPSPLWQKTITFPKSVFGTLPLVYIQNLYYKVLLFEGGKKKGGAEEAKKEEVKKEEIKFDPITPKSLMMGKPFGKANKKFNKVRHIVDTFVSSNTIHQVHIFYFHSAKYHVIVTNW